MDHAINALKEYMNSTINLYQGSLPVEDFKDEIQAYVNAINELELYYYGKKRTCIESVLSIYDRGAKYEDY